jgi:hypothetical protein
MALNKDAKLDTRFAAKGPFDERKTINGDIKYGMSVDSPFLTRHTPVHPTSKQILDYAYTNMQPEDPLKTLPMNLLSEAQLKKLPDSEREKILDQQICHLKHF